VFIHGRPGPNTLHAGMAQAIGADFVPIDFILRWHDTNSTPLRRYLSWLLCSLFFPNRRGYQIFLSEGLHFLPLVMRCLGLIDSSQKTVALLASETLYFLRVGRYPRSTERALRWALAKYDGLVCVGRMQAELAKSLVPASRAPLILTVSGGVSFQRRLDLGQARLALEGHTIVFIANGPGGWRGWCKGFDLLLHSVGLAAKRVRGLRLRIIGEWDREYVRDQVARSSCPPPELEVVGRVDDLVPYLTDAALYVHLARGDNFPISVLEAMCAGLPAIVSEWTGTREAVEQVDPRLVVPLDPEATAARILWYFELPAEHKLSLSEGCREVAARYTEERARDDFISVYQQMLQNFALQDGPS